MGGFSRRAEKRPRRKALRNRRRARVKRGARARASSQTKIAGNARRRRKFIPFAGWGICLPKPKADLQKTSSLQLRLAVRLAVLYVIGTGLAVAVLLFQAYSTAGSLNDRELSLRAEDLAHAVIKDSTGKTHLN